MLNVGRQQIAATMSAHGRREEYGTRDRDISIGRLLGYGVALFIATKDRWNWKKIFLWPLGIIVGLGVVGGSIAYLYQQYEDRPRKLTELWGVSLNDSAGDVKFKKGEPTRRLDNDLWVYRPYETIEGDYVVYFKNDRVRSVMYFGPMYNGPSVFGVGHYDSPQELDAKLGPPSYVSRAKDELHAEPIHMRNSISSFIFRRERCRHLESMIPPRVRSNSRKSPTEQRSPIELPNGSCQSIEAAS